MKHSKQYIIWLDEVGRWPLAGPVTVGGVFCLPWFDINRYEWVTMITDSKKLTSIKREYLAQQLLSCPDIIYATSFASAKYIDRHGIVAAIRKASLEVIEQIRMQTNTLLGYDFDKNLNILLDWTTDYGLRKNLSLPLKTIVKWDSLIREIGAASIIAKVQRDAYMNSLSHKKKYRFYEFHRHKWYGTLFHRTALAHYGLSDMHRASFCKNIIFSNNWPRDHWSDQ